MLNCHKSFLFQWTGGGGINIMRKRHILTIYVYYLSPFFAWDNWLPVCALCTLEIPAEILRCIRARRSLCLTDIYEDFIERSVVNLINIKFHEELLSVSRVKNVVYKVKNVESVNNHASCVFVFFFRANLC